MKLWLDAQRSPLIADWITATFAHEAVPVRALGFRDATDAAIFAAARTADVVVLTKDRDFVDLLERHGPPRACSGSPAATPRTRVFERCSRRRCRRPPGSRRG